jgi:hypothetical protein
MSWLVFYCTVPSDRVEERVFAILVLISFYGVFFSRSCPWCFRSDYRALNTILIAQWSKPCSILSMAYLIIESIRFSKARTKLIVDSQSLLCPLLCYIFVPYLRRLLRAHSFIRLMIGSASPYLPNNISSPPQSWSYQLKSPIIIISTTVPISHCTFIIMLSKWLHVLSKAEALPPSM